MKCKSRKGSGQQWDKVRRSLARKGIKTNSNQQKYGGNISEEEKQAILDDLKKEQKNVNPFALDFKEEEKPQKKIGKTPQSKNSK